MAKIVDSFGIMNEMDGEGFEINIAKELLIQIHCNNESTLDEIIDEFESALNELNCYYDGLD